MIQATIEDLLSDDLDERDTGGHRLYVVRDGDVIFYVGQSKDPVNRLLNHLGRGEGPGSLSFPSDLGMLIINNLPAAKSWQIDLLTPGECGVQGTEIKGYTREEWEAASVLITGALPWDESMAETQVFYHDWDVDWAEELAIEALHPCLNVTHNRHPSSLPMRYLARRAPVDIYNIRLLDLNRLGEQP